MRYYYFQVACDFNDTGRHADPNQGLVNDGASIVSYNPHFEAAITLLRFRGDEQFSTPQGTEMFDFVMQVMVRSFGNQSYVFLSGNLAVDLDTNNYHRCGNTS